MFAALRRPATLSVVLLPQLLATLSSPAFAQAVDSLTLPEALSLARARSPARAAASAGVRQVESMLAVARAGNRPRALGSALYLHYQDPPSLALGTAASYAPIPTNGYLLQVGVTQPLYTGGRVSAAVNAAESAVRAAQAQRAAVDVELTAAVTHAWDDALLARALLDVADKGASVLRDAVRVAREHYDAGTVSRLDVLRAETRLARSEARMREARDARESAVDRLAAVIGIDASAASPAGALVFDESVTASASVGALAAEVTGSPAIDALRRTAESWRARARSAASAKRPAVSLYGSAIALRPELVTGREEWTAQWLAGLQVSWPFLDSGQSKGEADAAMAAADRATAEAEQAELHAAAEARSYYRDLRRAAIDVESGRSNVVRAERALEIARDRYTDGIGMQLEVLEAEADLTSARTDLLRAVHAHRSALIELKRVAGLAADAPLPDPAGGEE